MNTKEEVLELLDNSPVYSTWNQLEEFCLEVIPAMETEMENLKKRCNGKIGAEYRRAYHLRRKAQELLYSLRIFDPGCILPEESNVRITTIEIK